MSDKLKKTIDRMVEDSIRRILPSVMNEVLLQTIANANVLRESRTPAPEPVASKSQAKRFAVQRRPSSLDQLLDPEAGVDFYNDPRAVQEEPQPRGQVIAQRIQNLPPQFQSLAEGMDLDDDGGEMWESDTGDSSPVVASGPGPSLRQGQAAGLDFSRMKQSLGVVEKKKVLTGADAAAKAQFEEGRIKRMRESLNGGKPVE